MTKNGLVERNIANGDVKNISKQRQDFELRKDDKVQNTLCKNRTIKSNRRKRANIPRNTVDNSSVSVFKPESNTANIIDSKENNNVSNIKNYEFTERRTLKIRAVPAINSSKSVEPAAISSENPDNISTTKTSAADVKKQGGQIETSLIFKNSENTALKFTKDEQDTEMSASNDIQNTPSEISPMPKVRQSVNHINPARVRVSNSGSKLNMLRSASLLFSRQPKRKKKTSPQYQQRRKKAYEIITSEKQSDIEISETQTSPLSEKPIINNVSENSVKSETFKFKSSRSVKLQDNPLISDGKKITDNNNGNISKVKSLPNKYRQATSIQSSYAQKISDKKSSDITESSKLKSEVKSEPKLQAKEPVKLLENSSKLFFSDNKQESINNTLTADKIKITPAKRKFYRYVQTVKSADIIDGSQSEIKSELKSDTTEPVSIKLPETTANISTVSKVSKFKVENKSKLNTGEPVNFNFEKSANIAHVSNNSKTEIKNESKLKINEPVKSSEKSKTDTSPENTSNKKLDHVKDMADKYNDKLEKVRDKLPSKAKVIKVRDFNEKTGKAESKLKFEKEILPPNTPKNAPMIISTPLSLAKSGTGSALRFGSSKFHQKMYEVENDNVSVKAAHRVEKLGESVGRSAFHQTNEAVRSVFRYAKNTPYRRVEKLERKSAKANLKYNRQKIKADNPKLKSNMISRMWQKRRTQQQYAKAAKDAEKAAQTVKKTGGSALRAARAVAEVIAKHPVVIGVILAILASLLIVASMFMAFMNMAVSSMSSITSSMYLSQDEDINQTELDYTEWENNLRVQINNIPVDYPHYDEYRYNIDAIGHDPLELMAYLTAVFQEFIYADIQAELQEIFNMQYDLELVESIEIHYDSDGEPYDWRVLTVTLTTKSLSDIFSELMNGEQAELYAILLESKGNRQYVGSPFAFDWQSNITSPFGHRISPITGAAEFHRGIDIAVPYGTEILAANTGVVTVSEYHNSYGNYIVIRSDNGIETLYAHCSELIVSVGDEVTQGDIIAKVGSTGDSTGNHLHFEVRKSGLHINPIFFSLLR